MKAIMKVEKKYGGIKVAEIEEPVLDPHEVLVRIHNASICGSDLHAYQFSPTHHYIETPIIMGHESSGEVVEVGSQVTNFKPGDRVVINAIVYCGKCDACLQGRFNLCADFKIRGMRQNGVFAERVAVDPKYLHRIPDTLSFEHACLVEPVAVSIHAVLDRSRIKPGDLVLVVGPGPIGLLTSQIVKVMGAEPIVAGIDSDEKVRLPIARELGCQTVNLSKQALTDFLKNIYKRDTVNWTLECSGSSAVIQTCLEVTAKGGGITLVGLYANIVQADLTLAVRKEIDICTSCAYNWENFERSIKLLDQRKIRIDELIALYKPEDAVRAFEDAIAQKIAKPVFVF
jgi:L-iditol 2-dehydrogenase